MLFGKPGTGKSTTVKAILFRSMRFGVRTLVAGDVKDEYEPLCRAVGVEPFSLGVGLPARINPLDPGPLAHRRAAAARRCAAAAGPADLRPMAGAAAGPGRSAARDHNPVR